MKLLIDIPEEDWKFLKESDGDWIAEMFYNGYIDLVRKVG